MPPGCALLGGFAIAARDALLWQHYANAWQSPAVIRQAQRTPHALRTHARTSDKIDAPAACATFSATRLFHLVHTACAGVATQTRNVSEYMLVLALCLPR